MTRLIVRSLVSATLTAGAAWGQLLNMSCAPATLPEVVGSAVSVACAASGGLEPYTWSISAGQLPPGLTLTPSGNTTSATIAGTLTDPAGPYSFTVLVIDSTPIFPLQASQNYGGVTVDPLLASCTGTNGPVEVGVLYTNSCSASGGTQPYSWSILGTTVPAGLTVSSTPPGTSASISYTPTAAGAYQYSVVATDSSSPQLQKGQQFTGTIAPAVTIATPATLPAAAVGSLYSQSFAVATGTGVAPFVWSASGLTNGLSMTAAGLLSGTPTVPGPVSFSVMVTDGAGGTTNSTFSLTVMAISPLPAATIGQAYNQTLTASGGTAPYTWTLTGGSLPSGLAGPTGAGVITGTPLPSAVTSIFTVTVKDSNSNSISGSVTLPVNLVVATTSPLPGATIGTQYSQALTAEGGAGGYSWSVTTGSSLPSWLQLSTSGTLNGLPPATAVTASFSVTVTDSAKATAAATLTLPVALAITTNTLPNGAVNAFYSQTLAGGGGTPPYAWKLASGALPTGLTLNPSSGLINGTPQTANTFQFTIQLSDSASPANSATKSYQIVISSGVVITTTTLPNATVGIAYSQTLQAAGGAAPYTWSPAGPLPGALAALSLSGGGVITGTPSAPGTGTFTVSVTDNNGSISQQSLTLTIVKAPAITTPATLPTGEVNIAYSQTLAETGGTPPYTWSVTGGSLPAGLGLSGAGALTGKPSTAGTYGFTVQVTDSNNVTASAALSVTIAATLSVSTTALNGGSVSAGYSQSLAASGGVGPYSWAVGSGLPPGLVFSAGGVLAGTPNTAGTFTFTATVTDSLGATASRPFTIVISAGLAISTAPTLPGGTVGAQYSITLDASGGTPPYTWTNPAGLLPGGLSLETGGRLAGIPNAAGSFSFTVAVSDSAGHAATEQMSVTVAAALSITTSSLAGGTVGGAYAQSVTATGGTPPYTWSLHSGSLPGGLALSATGSITGTATAAGTFSFVLVVTDSTGVTAQKQFTITVTGGLSITTAGTLPNASLNVSYSQTLGAAGGTPPYSWALTSGALPKGLALSAAGAISGTPAASGTFQFTVTVTDSAQLTASQQFTLVVSGGGLTITTATLPGGKAGTTYSETLAASGGTPPYTFAVSAGALPPGLTLAGAVISGTPTTPGTYSFTIEVTDSTAATATQQFTIVITGVVITTAPILPSAALGTAYSQTLSATGSGPYTWDVTAGALPNGLSLGSSSGTISGTPAAGGTSNATIQATDSSGATASVAFTLTVISASFTGLSSTAASAQQVSFSLALGAGYPQAISGQVTLAFQPDASLTAPADDPAIQFASSGASASFTIAADSTAVVPLAIQTGTVAGTITLTVSWQAAGVSLAVPAALTQTIQIAPAVPVISGVTAAATSSGFQVTVTGYSNTREVSQAALQFTAASGQTLQTTSLTVSLTSAASTWFGGSNSDQYGGQFILTLPFTVSNGSASGIGSVTVTLVNSQGSSTASNASF